MGCASPNLSLEVSQKAHNAREEGWTSPDWLRFGEGPCSVGGGAALADALE